MTQTQHRTLMRLTGAATECDMLNALSDQGLISDLAVTASDVATVDAETAILKLGGSEQQTFF